MSKASVDWYVQKYGILIQQKDITFDNDCITTKLYYYEGRKFIETWCNGIRLMFHEVI